MYEKVNPSHPDKIADRIAGAIVDEAYRRQEDPRIAVEVLIGHGYCTVILESSVDIDYDFINSTVNRITNDPKILVKSVIVPQDTYLASNQLDKMRCGDNGIFRGTPITNEQRELIDLAEWLYSSIPYDGKFIIDAESEKLIICQSHVNGDDLDDALSALRYSIIVNPLGDWTGGIDVDTGATNRKLGSDMGDAVTGGGLHGKDLSKADVSLNIYAHLKAQELDCPVELFCAIGDEYVDGKSYSEIVEIARDYIHRIGGFEKFAEWGLLH